MDGVTRLYGTGGSEGNRDWETRETWDDLGVCVVRCESPVHYYALFSLARTPRGRVHLLGGGVGCKYTGFVTRSRAVAAGQPTRAREQAQRERRRGDATRVAPAMGRRGIH